MEPVSADTSMPAFRERAERHASRGQFLSLAIELVRATGISRWGKHVGEEAAAATLPGARGEVISLQERWSRGPLVVVFYRGGWCGSCIRQLRAWEANVAALASLGASLVAVAPEPVDRLRDTVRTHKLSFPVLSDERLEAAGAFDVALSLPPELVELYAFVGADAPVLDARGQWAMPIPATFLVGCDGRILFAHVDMDGPERTAPAKGIRLVRRVRSGRALG